jgi:hypothetical protein
MTKVGPALHLPLSISGSVPVGQAIAGPMPQVTPPGVLLGEKKKLCSVSPRPKVLSSPGAGAPSPR